MKLGRVPHPLVSEKARSKLLKRKRLVVVQFGKEMPFFRQATEWRKWETLWAIVVRCPRQLYGTGIALEASK